MLNQTVSFDYVVVGFGIMGLSIARELSMFIVDSINDNSLIKGLA